MGGGRGARATGPGRGRCGGGSGRGRRCGRRVPCFAAALENAGRWVVVAGRGRRARGAVGAVAGPAGGGSAVGGCPGRGDGWRRGPRPAAPTGATARTRGRAGTGGGHGRPVRGRAYRPRERPSRTITGTSTPGAPVHAKPQHPLAPRPRGRGGAHGGAGGGTSLRGDEYGRGHRRHGRGRSAAGRRGRVRCGGTVGCCDSAGRRCCVCRGGSAGRRGWAHRCGPAGRCASERCGGRRRCGSAGRCAPARCGRSARHRGEAGRGPGRRAPGSRLRRRLR
ncbi:hypothetical protein FEF34_19980 [Streptomyces marianii]|uniref:Uncharacterized protein n=1 Tax=Streptomyces marianii TaxID=1817406 RepID=A0A5R9E839_9ACTN|nr:hypothetical protein FEF34_19980 [Streptomyces marianii]